MKRNRSKQQQSLHGNGVTAAPDGVASSESKSRLEHPAAAVLAFHRDLPRLLEQHARQWVAYCGDRQMGFAATKTELHQQLLGNGLACHEFEIFYVEPEMPDPVEVNWSSIG